MWLLSGNNFSNHGTFFRSFVRKHCSANHITNGIDVFNIGLKMIVYVNHASLGNFNASILGLKAICVRLSSNGNQAIITLKSYFFIIFIGCSYGYFFSFFGNCGNFMRNVEFYSLFLHHLHQFLALGRIHGWDDSVHIFHYGNFGTQTAIYLPKFKTNHTTANYNEVFWNFF